MIVQHRRSARPIGLIILALACSHPARAQNDIEAVRVETYYIADAQDATDTIGGGVEAGARTYRIFLDLVPGSNLRAIYGRDGHPLRIESTALLFNHHDRGKKYGHEINNSALDEGVVALDSWLSLGAASNQRAGMRKELDPDGSILGGTANNDGGSEEVPEGLLINSVPEMGFALTERDGLIPHPDGVAPPNFLHTGDDPDDAFGDSTLVTGLISYDIRVGCSTPGVHGPDEANELLVAQITTPGELSFSLNIEVEQANGSVVRYVAENTELAPDETANGFLTYPPLCGCTDPQFLEYDPAAGCDDGSCATTIVYGCLDMAACNYDPDANFNVTALCCYGPGNCNGLDVDLLCPGVGIAERPATGSLLIFPDPIQNGRLVIHDAPDGVSQLTVVDHSGREVWRNEGASDRGVLNADVSILRAGLYTLRMLGQDKLYTARFIIL